MATLGVSFESLRIFAAILLGKKCLVARMDFADSSHERSHGAKSEIPSSIGIIRKTRIPKCCGLLLPLCRRSVYSVIHALVDRAGHKAPRSDWTADGATAM
jgi:hypothetical protein